MRIISLPDEFIICQIDDEQRIGIKRIYYKKFFLDDEAFYINDDVFLHNSLTQNKKLLSKNQIKQNAYVVRIKEIFVDKYDNLFKYRAHVQWFWREYEFSEEQLNTFDGNLKSNELVLDTSAMFDKEIELNSVICKTLIKYHTDLPNLDIYRSNSIKKHDFIVSKIFNGKSIVNMVDIEQKLNPNLLTPKKSDQILDQNSLDNNNNFGTPKTLKFRQTIDEFLTPKRSILTNKFNSLKLSSITPKKVRSLKYSLNSNINDFPQNDVFSNSLDSSLNTQNLELDSNSSIIETRSTRSQRSIKNENLSSSIIDQTYNRSKKSFSFNIKKNPSNQTKFRAKRKSIRDVNFAEDTISNQNIESNDEEPIICCRESQYDKIFNSLCSHIISKSGGCIFISGVPGTGKTATMTNVVHNISKKFDSKELKIIQMNALNFFEPKDFYDYLASSFKGYNLKSLDSLKYLNSIFDAQKIDKMISTLLVVDEIDYLLTKSQDIFYSIFNWANSLNSKLIVVTLSNTFDLPERMMSNKIISRLGLTRINFTPYTFNELFEIAKSRFKKSEIQFNSDALQFICRKIAAGSGDARRLFEVANQSLKIASKSYNNLSTISLKMVDEILKKLYSSKKIDIIKSLSLKEKEFLRFIASEFELLESSYNNDEEDQSNYIIVDTLFDKYLAKQLMEKKTQCTMKSHLQLMVTFFITIGILTQEIIHKGCVIYHGLKILTSSTDLIIATN